MGALLYDTINYGISVKDLEDLLDKAKEHDVGSGSTTEQGEPILTKVYIHKKCAKEVLERLELMGILGRNLFKDESGLAMDIINLYFYNTRTQFLRDLRTPLLDDTKM